MTSASHRATPFGLIILLWLAGLGAAGQYAKVSVIFDRLSEIYPTGGIALGFIVSIVGFVGIVFGVVAGLLVARVGYRRALLWALWAGAGLSALQAMFPPMWLMLTLRGLEGLSHLAIVVATPTLIAQLSAPQHRGLTLTLWSTFFSVAFTMLVWLGLPMVARLGLSSLFVAHAIWMAGCALVLSRSLRALDGPKPQKIMSLQGVGREHRVLYSSPFLAAPAVGWLFYTFCFLAILTLIPPFIDPGQRAFVLGAMPLMSILVSMTVGVWMLRFLTAVQVVVIGFGTSVLALAWLLVSPGGALACFVLAGTLGLVQGATFAAVPQLNKTPETQAQSNGAMAQMGNLGNTLGTPVMAAIILGAGYGGMIWSAIVIFCLGVAVHLWMSRARQMTEAVS